MRHDHRRILATAISRLRGKLKYRPVVFELMPETFTLTELQRTVEAISGRHLHKQNFRRLVEKGQLVEPTGAASTDDRRPAGGALPLPPRGAAGAPGARLPARRSRMKAPPLVFIRHGETDWNRDLRFQGQRDIPLNARGRRQAARNGRAVAGILARSRLTLVASPLGRAVETMRIVLDAAGDGGRGFATDAVLMEANYGEWEGLTMDEIAERRPAEARARDADKWGYAPPNGESYKHVSERVTQLARRRSMAPTFVVAHGGILRALLYLLAGLPAHDAPHLAVPQDRVILFTESDVLTI